MHQPTRRSNDRFQRPRLHPVPRRIDSRSAAEHFVPARAKRAARRSRSSKVGSLGGPYDGERSPRRLRRGGHPLDPSPRSPRLCLVRPIPLFIPHASDFFLRPGEDSGRCRSEQRKQRICLCFENDPPFAVNARLEPVTGLDPRVPHHLSRNRNLSLASDFDLAVSLSRGRLIPYFRIHY